ncbi:CDI domain-containing protein [Pycnococcus provasolii]
MATNFLSESAASGGYGLVIPLPAPLPTPQPAQLNYERSRKRGMFSPPSEEDLWSFFADNERRQRQRFLQDWGFDIRTDKPAVKVDGAADGSPWEWEEVEERSQKSTTIHAPCHELAVKRSTLRAGTTSPGKNERKSGVSPPRIKQPRRKRGTYCTRGAATEALRSLCSTA